MSARPVDVLAVMSSAYHHFAYAQGAEDIPLSIDLSKAYAAVSELIEACKARDAADAAVDPFSGLDAEKYPHLYQLRDARIAAVARYRAALARIRGVK